ncbi:MAG TPA: hypothetical protein PLC25_05000 [Bacilli bacterium]|nr:hypothetical protein [Bacilli bacterium]
MKIEKIEELVKETMIDDPVSRDDDYILILEVLKKVNFDVNFQMFSTIMKTHKELGLPSLESITRARRKLQNKYPELRSSKQVEKARKMKEEEIKNYVLQN